MGGGDQPGYTVAVLDGWGVHGGFVIKYASAGPGPVLGISVWDVGRVFRDPCRWPPARPLASARGSSPRGSRRGRTASLAHAASQTPPSGPDLFVPCGGV